MTWEDNWAVFYWLAVVVLFVFWSFAKLHQVKQDRKADKANRLLDDQLLTRFGGDLPIMSGGQGAIQADASRSARPVFALTSEQRRLLEAWLRAKPQIEEYWRLDASRTTSHRTSRRILIRDSIEQELARLDVGRLLGLRLQYEGQAKDVLGLLEKPVHDAVAYLRWREQAASKFNRTTAEIFIEREKESHPEFDGQWAQRKTSGITLCAAHFFNVNVRELHFNLLAEQRIADKIAIADPRKVARWVELREFLLCIERGDFESCLVPALSCVFVYKAIAKRAGNLTTPIERDLILKNIAALSAEMKARNVSNAKSDSEFATILGGISQLSTPSGHSMLPSS